MNAEYDACCFILVIDLGSPERSVNYSLERR